MYFLWIVPGVIAIVVVLAFVSEARESRKQLGLDRAGKQRRERFDTALADLLARAEVEGALEHDSALRREVEDFSTYGYTLGTDFRLRHARVVEAARQIRSFENRVIHVREDRTRYLECVPGSLDALVALDVLQRTLGFYANTLDRQAKLEARTGLSLAELRDQLGAAAADFMASRAERAATDRSAYNDLVEFYNNWLYHSEYLKELPVVSQRLDWATWAILYFENPSLSDFRIAKVDPPMGELRLRAARALLANDLTEIMIVLAYTTASKVGAYYRAELGDVLLADLAWAAVVLRADMLSRAGEPPARA